MSIKAAFAGILGLTATATHSTPSVDGVIDGPPALVWERDLPGARVPAASHTELGDPLIVGQHILVGSAGSNALYALNRHSGAVDHVYPTAGPVQAAPVLNDDRIVISDAAGYTWCYRLGAEKEEWKHYGGAPIMSSAAVENDRVYVANVGSAVYALSLDDGSLVWRHLQERDVQRKSRMELFGAPSPVVSGELVLVGFHDGSLVALTRDTGERQWQRRVGEGRYPDVLGEPLMADNDVIVAGFSEPLMSLNLETRNVRWRIDAGGTSAAVIDRDWIVHGGTDGKLRSVDKLTGAPRWVWEAPSSGSLTQPIVTEAGILVGSSTDSLYLIDDETGEERWHFDPGYRVAGVSANVAVDGRQIVVVTNAGRIMSLVVPTPAAGWAKNVGILPQGGMNE
jgi:outer membrane protein assembly factor BamB